MPQPYAFLLAAEGLRLFGAGFFYLPLYLLAAEKARAPLEAVLPQTFLYAAGLASLLVGALLDRFERRRVLVLTALGQGFLTLALFPAPFLPLLYLLLLLLLFELLDRFRALAAGLYLRSLVPKEAYEGKLGRLSALHFAADTLSDPVAGAAYARNPGLPPLLGGPLLFLSAFLYRRLPPAPPPKPGGPFRLREAFAGLGFLWNHPLLRRVFLIARVHGLVHGATFALLPLYTLRGLEAPAWVYGLLSGAWGLGAAAGALLLEKLLPLGRGNLARGSLLLLGAPLLGLTLLPPWPLAVGLLFLFGLGQQFWSLLVTSLLYRELPEELVGRGMGGVGFVSSLLAPLGSLLGGALAGLALPLPFLLAGALLLGLVPLVGRGWR
ncbi:MULTISPECIES: MFS transporter [Thermus]|uniref:MFS transporter n=1 Tax=Thermus parvatiensis TaxID=456163 RepID=H7GG68_9DEIN|nr:MULTISPECIES: MFS transporter [Thermus]EIA39192.1 hypothetical protein RLTM_05816 [Thermus parvatiensis]